MRIWIDNTGLQSAGVCLDGRGKSNFDAKGLLQFATFLVYGNRTLINGFEADPISSKTKEFKEQFTDLGVPTDAIHIDDDISESTYASACEEAAKNAAECLYYEFNPREFEILAGEPPDLPRGAIGRQVDFVQLAGADSGSEALASKKQNALKDKAVGACEYMLASSEELRNEVLKYKDSLKQWDDSYSYLSSPVWL